MVVEKVCKACRAVFSGANKCPSCGSDEITDSFKGKVVVIDPEQSEVAKNLKINKKGVYAVKLG